MSATDPSHRELSTLAREYLLAGHLVDRAGMPHVISALGRDAMTAVAVEEWSGASPVYTRRMQRALGFAGDDVATIFKGMQLDIGAPPEFLDFRFEVVDDHHGRFHLDHCGALADVEPLGEDYVVAMCHHIEDPTFDATAAATNPYARMRPVHRPPRVPLDRRPVCEWIVDIDETRPPIPFPEAAARIAATRAALIDLDVDPGPAQPGSAADGRRSDYSGPFDADLVVEDFTASALAVLCAEAALQGHLLAMSFGLGVQRRTDEARATAMLEHQLIGVAGVVARRLRDAFEVGDDLAGIAAVLARHPLFGPRPYVDVTVQRDAAAVRVELASCPATQESTPGWIGVLAADGVAVIAAIAENVDPFATVERVERVGRPGTVAAWEITMGDRAAPERDDVALTRISSGAEFVFRRIGRRTPPGPAR